MIGATVFETKAAYTRGPYHFHDGVEEWMYVVSGEPVLRDQSGERALEPGTLVAFQSGPAGAHTFDGPGRVVMFSMGARGWTEAFTSVYLDADKTGGKPGVQFLRTAALETSTESAVVPEGEAGAHQFLNQADEPAWLLFCSAPVTGPSAAVYPDDDTYVLRVPGQTGYRFRLSDQLLDYCDGEPGAGTA